MQQIEANQIESADRPLSDSAWSARLTGAIVAVLLILSAAWFVGHRSPKKIIQPNFPDARLVFRYSTGGFSSMPLNVSSETVVNGVESSTKYTGSTTISNERWGTIAYDFKLIDTSAQGDSYLVTIQENGATCFQDSVRMTGDVVPLVRLCDEWLEISLHPSQASAATLASPVPSNE